MVWLLKGLKPLELQVFAYLLKNGRGLQYDMNKTLPCGQRPLRKALQHLLDEKVVVKSMRSKFFGRRHIRTGLRELRLIPEYQINPESRIAKQMETELDYRLHEMAMTLLFK